MRRDNKIQELFAINFSITPPPHLESFITSVLFSFISVLHTLMNSRDRKLTGGKMMMINGITATNYNIS